MKVATSSSTTFQHKRNVGQFLSCATNVSNFLTRKSTKSSNRMLEQKISAVFDSSDTPAHSSSKEGPILGHMMQWLKKNQKRTRKYLECS